MTAEEKIARLREALRKIAEFGNKYPGRGWSCAKMAREALEEEK